MKESSVVTRIQEEAMGARDKGINGVPHFNVHIKGDNCNIASFSGAQPPDTFKSIFQHLLTQLKSSV